jgi:hypothetical protein
MGHTQASHCEKPCDQCRHGHRYRYERIHRQRVLSWLIVRVPGDALGTYELLMCRTGISKKRSSCPGRTCDRGIVDRRGLTSTFHHSGLLSLGGCRPQHRWDPHMDSHVDGQCNAMKSFFAIAAIETCARWEVDGVWAAPGTIRARTNLPSQDGIHDLDGVFVAAIRRITMRSFRKPKLAFRPEPSRSKDDIAFSKYLCRTGGRPRIHSRGDRPITSSLSIWTGSGGYLYGTQQSRNEQSAAPAISHSESHHRRPPGRPRILTILGPPDEG